MKKLLILIIIYAGCTLPGIAQKELSLSVSYEIPIDEFKWSFRPANNYQLSFSKSDKYKNRRKNWGIRIGYTKFVPHEDIYYFQVGESEYGTISFSDYKSFQFILDLREDFILNKKLELFLGCQAGLQQIILDYYLAYPGQTEDGGYNVTGGLLSAKSGANFLISPKFSISIFGKGTFSVSPTSEVSKDIFNFLLAPGTGINYRF